MDERPDHWSKSYLYTFLFLLANKMEPREYTITNPRHFSSLVYTQGGFHSPQRNMNSTLYIHKRSVMYIQCTLCATYNSPQTFLGEAGPMTFRTKKVLHARKVINFKKPTIITIFDVSEKINIEDKKNQLSGHLNKTVIHLRKI